MIRAALDRPISTAIGTISLVVLGVFALYRLPIALLPEIDRTIVRIEATATGLSIEELTSGLTVPLERRLASIEGVRSIRSTTEQGLVRVILESDWEVNAERLQIEISRRVQDAGEIRPDSLRISAVDLSDTPILEIAVTGGSARSRTDLVEHVLMPELSRVPGAGRIDVAGLAPSNVEVTLSLADLAAHGVTASQVVDRLREVGSTRASGRVVQGAVTRSLVLIEPIASVASLERIMVSGASGQVPLVEIASIRIREDQTQGQVSIDGDPGVLVSVHRGAGANVVTLASGVRESLSRLQTHLRPGITIGVVTDRSREISAAIRDLAIAALGGLLLGTVLLRWMLGHWRTTLALSAVIPASIATAMIAFYLFGVPLDIVSISGLALAAGMLVDNSIVVADSIEQVRAEGSPEPEIEGTRRIVRPIIVATLTTVVVFLPFLFLRGLARAFFGEQAFAVIVSIAASLLFSLTLTPLLCRRRASVTPNPPVVGQRTHLGLIDRLAPHRFLTLSISVALVLAALLLPMIMQRELFPRSSTSLLQADLELPSGMTEDERAERFSDIERRLVSLRSQENFGQFVLSIDPEEYAEPVRGRVLIQVDQRHDPNAAIRVLQEEIATPGFLTEWRQTSSALVESLGTSHSIEIVATAADAQRASVLAENASRHLAERGIGTTSAERQPAGASLALNWDRRRLAELGESASALEQQIEVTFGDSRVGRSDIAGASSSIRVAALPLTDPGQMPIRLASGNVVPLAALADLSWTDRPPARQRVSLRPAESLRVDDPQADPFAIANALSKVPASSGDGLLLTGSALDLRQSFEDLGLAAILSLILVYLVLAAAYESLTIPPLVMITVPVAASGALLALLITGQTLNLLSLIGIIVLGGIVVNNAIVLVDRAEELRGSLGSSGAARQAATERYRPIILTTLTTLCGMLPLALLGGEGVDLRRALATSVVGGLIAALIASLLIVPLLYPLIRRDPRE